MSNGNPATRDDAIQMGRLARGLHTGRTIRIYEIPAKLNSREEGGVGRTSPDRRQKFRTQINRIATVIPTVRRGMLRFLFPVSILSSATRKPLLALCCGGKIYPRKERHENVHQW